MALALVVMCSAYVAKDMPTREPISFELGSNVSNYVRNRLRRLSVSSMLAAPSFLRAPQFSSVRLRRALRSPAQVTAHGAGKPSSHRFQLPLPLPHVFLTLW